MILKTVYVRHFRSFNFDFLRQDLVAQKKFPWDEMLGIDDYEVADEEDQSADGSITDDDNEGQLAQEEVAAAPDRVIVDAGLLDDPASLAADEADTDQVLGDSYYPFVKVDLERDITTVVGANESGKSQLITAVQCLLGAHKIGPRDFCRYSKFFGVRRSMRLPEFGGYFVDLAARERISISSIMGRDVPGDFWFFRLQGGSFIYVEEVDGSITTLPLTSDQLNKLPLPTARRIDANVVLPSSASLFDLAATETSPEPRSRNDWLNLFKQLKMISKDSEAQAAAISTLFPSIGTRQKVDVDRDEQ